MDPGKQRRKQKNRKFDFDLKSQIYCVVLWIQVVPPAGELPLGIPHSFSSFGLLLAEIVVGIIQYDAYFFFLHWTMHEWRSLHFLFHNEHHHPKILEARHVLR